MKYQTSQQDAPLTGSYRLNCLRIERDGVGRDEGYNKIAVRTQTMFSHVGNNHKHERQLGLTMQNLRALEDVTAANAASSGSR